MPKNRLDNLIPLDSLPPDKRKEIQSKGGKASAAKRKSMKAIGEVAKAFLDCNCSEKMKKELQEKYGLSDDVMSNRLPLVLRLYTLATSNDEVGQNITAIRLLIELAGESPEQIERKNIEQLKQLEVEDDPFSASIKKMYQGNGDEDK